MPVNAEAIKLTMKFIENDQEHWDQSAFYGVVRGVVRGPIQRDTEGYLVPYACNTTMCMAGHAAVLAGARHIDGFSCKAPDGWVRPVEAVARDYLGLTQVEAHALFYDSIGIEDFSAFRDLVERVTGVQLDD